MNRNHSLKVGAIFLAMTGFIHGCASVSQMAADLTPAAPPARAPLLKLDSVPAGAETDPAAFLDAWLGPHHDVNGTRFVKSSTKAIPMPQSEIHEAGENIRAGIALWCAANGLVYQSKELENEYHESCVEDDGALHTLFEVHRFYDPFDRAWDDSMRFIVYLKTPRQRHFYNSNISTIS